MNSLTCFTRRGSIRTSTWIAGKGWRNQTAFTSARLQFAEWWAHHTKSTQTCKESVESFRVQDHGGLPRFTPENGRMLVGGSFLEACAWNITVGSSTLLYIAGPVLGRSAKRDRSAAGAVERCGHASVYGARDTSWDFDGEQAVCKGQQPACNRLRAKKTK